jgi:hypothetical protein
MNTGETNTRTDPALIGMFDETTAWAVRGERGAPMGQTNSLRDALTVASALRRAGRKVIALTQPPNDHIIVFQGQIERLLEARD